MRSVRGIYRYPIKGLSPAPLRSIELQAGQPFPFDRVFALVQPGMPIDPEAPRWAKKGLFLMLMMDEELARFDTFVDPDTLELRVYRPREVRAWLSFEVAGGRDRRDAADGEQLLAADLKTQAGRSAVEAFFQSRVPRLSAPPRLVHAQGGHFMDKPDSVMSCMNLTTLKSLEADWGVPLHPLRFRANFYIEGGEPWEEFSWLGKKLQLGGVTFRVDRKNGRCGATNVNPLTAERDLDIPGSLRKHFGHKDLGVYLVAETSGKVALGDAVVAPDSTSPGVGPGTFSAPGSTSFICRGCYYVYVPERGAPGIAPGTPFADLPGDFPCPDCGTGKASFRSYGPE